jgi:flagellar hook-associated protein 1
MRPAFLGLNIARSALLTQQQQLDVTGHNIANASVEGYSRQRLDVSAAPDIYGLGQQYPGAIGEGVQAQQLERLRNGLLDKDYRRENADGQNFTTQADYLGRLENIFGELGDTGLSTELDNFFNAWQDASQRPEDLALRRVLVESGVRLAEQIKNIDADTQDLQASAQQELEQTVNRVNALTERISNLNTEIAKRTGGGDTPADLLDERDRALDELSQYAKFTVRQNALNKIEVQIDGKAVVDDERSHPIQLFSDPDILRGGSTTAFPVTLQGGDLIINGVDIFAGTPLTLNNAADKALLVDRINQQTASTNIRASLDPANQLVLQGTAPGTSYLSLQQSGRGLNTTGIENNTYTLTSRSVLQLRTGTFIENPGGQLAGLSQVRNGEIPKTLDKLQEITNTLINRVNAVHEQAYNLQGISGQPFFTGSNPGTMAVAQSLVAAPERVAMAATAAFPPGDGSQGLAIYGLRSQLGLGTQYQSMVTDLGVRIESLQDGASRQSKVVGQIENQRQSVAGVNLDEELANMLQFQRSFNAAARVLTTFDEMLNQIVNGLGLVGR